MKTNTKNPTLYTHEGAKASHISPEAQLRRSVMSCVLWESEFYEDGVSIAERIASLVARVTPQQAAAIAIEARTQMHLRHVPLWIVRQMARLPKHKAQVGELLPQIILRADELSEFVALYWKDGRQPLSKQVKKGLAAAFRRFDEYQLGKYDRSDAIVKLRDVLFLCHAKPKDEAQAALWKRLIDGQLITPDTWEVALSASQGEGKQEIWERLLGEGKLGGLALLRNLRNMREAGVSETLIKTSIAEMSVARILPFRFIAAARNAPQWETQLEDKFFQSIDGEKLPGKTAVLVDVSGSMEASLSAKSDMTRMDAACGVAMVAREVYDMVEVYSFSSNLKQVPARRGFALRDAIMNSQPHGGTYLGDAIRHLPDYDRLIVITDEQSHDNVPAPKGIGYIINVASNQNGIGYGPYIHINGWSEAVIYYIQQIESAQ